MYATAAAQSALTAVHNLSANVVEIVPTQYERDASDDQMVPGPQTASDASLIAAINAAQKHSLGVFLAPHIDVLDGTWRGSLHPTNTRIWFRSYQRYIDHYARIAQRAHVKLFSVGVELKSMSGPTYLADWTRIIRSVRHVYKGRIVYNANGTSANDEFVKVPFWHQLDYVGIDAYFPLSHVRKPDAQQLKAGWTHWIAVLKAFHHRVQMPIIFTEIGYPARSDANATPWTASGTKDPKLQAAAYLATFKAWSAGYPWFKGMFWWDWEIGSTPSPYSIAGRAAASVVRAWYGTPRP